MPQILFIASTRIGDAVLSTGALAYAQTLAPGAGVTIACGHLPAPIFRATPNLKALHVLTKRRGDAHWFELWKALSGERFDLAIDLRGTLVTYALHAKKRIVHRKRAEMRHKVEELSALVGAPKAVAPKLHHDDQARADARGALDLSGPLLVLGAGANFIGKRWRPDRFAAVARRLTAPSGPLAGAAVALLGGPGDETIAHEIVESLDADGVRAHDLTGKLDLLACGAFLERATLFIGNDSGLMHIAAAAGAPTLGLFGPSDERIYGPWGARARAVRGKSYDAIMAQGPLTAVDRTLMDDLGVDAVEAAAVQLLQAGGLA
ncbi:MAG: glycosyltransferase family 9 protein [Hyphomonadaceae bacterium]